MSEHTAKFGTPLDADAVVGTVERCFHHQQLILAPVFFAGLHVEEIPTDAYRLYENHGGLFRLLKVRLYHLRYLTQRHVLNVLCHNF